MEEIKITDEKAIYWVDKFSEWCECFECWKLHKLVSELNEQERLDEGRYVFDLRRKIIEKLYPDVAYLGNQLDDNQRERVWLLIIAMSLKEEFNYSIRKIAKVCNTNAMRISRLFKQYYGKGEM